MSAAGRACPGGRKGADGHVCGPCLGRQRMAAEKSGAEAPGAAPRGSGRRLFPSGAKPVGRVAARGQGRMRPRRRLVVGAFSAAVEGRGLARPGKIECPRPHRAWGKPHSFARRSAGGRQPCALRAALRLRRLSSRLCGGAPAGGRAAGDGKAAAALSARSVGVCPAWGTAFGFALRWRAAAGGKKAMAVGSARVFSFARASGDSLWLRPPLERRQNRELKARPEAGEKTRGNRRRGEERLGAFGPRLSGPERGRKGKRAGEAYGPCPEDGLLPASPGGAPAGGRPARCICGSRAQRFSCFHEGKPPSQPPQPRPGAR